MGKNKQERFNIFLQELTAASPASTRDEALDLVDRTMKKVEDEHSGLPRNDFGERMHVYGFHPNFNWKDLDSDPCYWDDSVSKTHRIYLYNSGRIEIFRMNAAGGKTPILDKPGA